MVRYSSAAAILLLCTLLFASAADDYAGIVSAYESNEYGTLPVLTETFLRKYPHSPLASDVRLIRAETETDPQKALVSLNRIVSTNPGFKQADYVRYRICEILYLLARWKDLETTSRRAIEVHGKNSRYYPDFIFFLSKATFYTHDYDESLQCAGAVIRDYRQHDGYPQLRLQTIYASQKIHYDSFDYAQSLKRSHFELQGTGSDISSLYLLGRHFEYAHDYNRAFSLYSDIIKKYPRSPEALLAKKRNVIITKHNPRYIRNVLATIKTGDGSIIQSLSPTRDVNEDDTLQYYALSIGPLYNLQAAEKLVAELGHTFSHVHVVRRYRDFVIYVGRVSSSEECMDLKIRLAEEYAINANIVYVTNHEGLNFVHGE
ncbi:MAG: hypothetical protein ACOCWH_03185 [Spirochaetota bacterium]